MLIVPLNYLTTLDHLKKLIDAGVDEFYMGYMPKQWYQKYGWEISSNKRYFPVIPHIVDQKKAEELISFIHKSKKKIFLTLNELYYSSEQLGLIFEIINLFEKLGVDGYIVADLALIVAMRKSKIDAEIHLSSCAGSYNLYAISFYRKFGIRRFTLPQLVTPKEAVTFLENTPKEVKFELFAMGEFCRYENAFCFTSHGYHRENFCNAFFNKSIIDKKSGLTRDEPKLLSPESAVAWCALCAMPKLMKYKGRIIFKLAFRLSNMLGFDSFDFVLKLAKLMKGRNLSPRQCKNLLGDTCRKNTACRLFSRA
jgi:hypothetical protein